MATERALVLGALVMLGGCSALFDPDRAQCASDDDCSAEVTGQPGLTCVSGLCTGRADDRWYCAGRPELPSPAVPITLHRAFVDLQSGAPVQVEVRVCNGLDATCASPAFGPVSSDANGLVTLEITSGFEGFLQVTSETHLPNVIVLSPAAVSETTPSPQPQVTAEGYAQLGVAAGTPPDLANAGHAFIGIFACPGESAAGVSFEVDRTLSTTARYYLQAGVPSLSLDRTDPSGRAGFVNLPEGIVTLIATDSATGEMLGRVPFLTRRGWITSVGFGGDDVSR
ncbi:hypothetical protein [Sandaracinus amylolyticus]|uniref:hypothetical protein n=1 Tax=Sandaracinus amylolyticus TaxID=927083 RepID=UPI00069D2CFA|nr:hypothetical protein [Sandaracinus amylolyticus]